MSVYAVGEYGSTGDTAVSETGCRSRISIPLNGASELVDGASVGLQRIEVSKSGIHEGDERLQSLMLEFQHDGAIK